MFGSTRETMNLSFDHRILAMQVDNVASSPMIFVRTNDAVNNLHSSTGKMVRVISEDTGLSSRLLRLADSAFYSFPSRIETITDCKPVHPWAQVNRGAEAQIDKLTRRLTEFPQVVENVGIAIAHCAQQK